MLRRGAGLGSLVIALLLLHAGTAAAAAPKLKLTAKPAVAAPGAKVAVSGRVAGTLRGARRSLRVTVEERTGRRWVRRVAVRPSRRLRFAARWRVPARAGTRKLRVRLLRGRRVLARSASWRLTVASPTQPAPGPTSPAPPALPPAAPVQQAQTQVLEPAAVEAAPGPGAAGTLRLTGAVPLRAGDVLASGIGEAAPYGFLLRATTVRTEGGDTVVDAVPATLLEAVPEGRIDRSFTFAPAAGARRRAAGDTSIPFRKIVNCTAEGTVTIEGSADLGGPQFELDADWGFMKLNAVEATASVTASASASATATAAGSCTVGPVEVFETKLPAVTFTVGAVPVVLVPEIEIELDGLGEVDAAVTTSVDASLTARAGARYEDGKLAPIAELDPSFDHQPPDPQGSAKLAATLSSELEVAAYGFGGPTFGFDAGLELDADIDATPWWTLDAPIAFTAGLDIDILDVEAGPVTVYEKRFRLAQAPGATAEAELSVSVDEQAQGGAQDAGPTCDLEPSTLNASASVSARSTRRVQLERSGDDRWQFSFGETDPSLTSASFGGSQMVECLGPDGYYDRQRWKLHGAAGSRFIYDEGPVYRDFAFVLPDDLRGQPVAHGDNGLWHIAGNGPFTTIERWWWPEHSSVEPGPAEWSVPPPPFSEGAGIGHMAMFMHDHGPGQRSMLPGSVTSPAPGIIVIQGGSTHATGSESWTSQVLDYSGTGSASSTITTRWKITIREGERPPGS